MLRFILLLFLSVSPLFLSAQFTYEDTLRGSITPERDWWDVQFYDIALKEVNPTEKSIRGTVRIGFKVVKDGFNTMQIDLREPMNIDSVYISEEEIFPLEFHRITNFAYLIKLPEIPQQTTLTICFSGQPVEAKNAPWDGGVVWSKDENGLDFIATACQGIGASSWFPCKDHPSDEPDKGVMISVTTPEHLMNVSNGKLLQNYVKNGKRTTEWQVVNPINTYGININIGNYASWDSIYHGKDYATIIKFYALKQHLPQAKQQFRQAFQVLEAFEHWFGPYPFYEDGYKLVEVPYLGMEHQSSVTYGNGFQNGYLGKDLSGTGWGLKWDFIIVHESGHEWFANNITCKDNADMWIHESFTTYSEGLFTEYYYGKEAGFEYIRGLRKNILNDRPVIGEYDVNHPGSHDMYYKGANMLHTIRQLVSDDEKWLQLLRGLNKDFYHQTVTTEDIESYISQFLGMDLSSVFDQYLRTKNVPKLEIIKEKKSVCYRWSNCISSFNMPIDVYINGRKQRIYPTIEFQKVKAKKWVVDENFYVE